MTKLLYTTSALFLVLIFFTSCTRHPEIPLLVSSSFLSSFDSIKKQAPHEITNLGNDAIGYSNLPMKLHNKRNSKKVHIAWDEIVNEYKSESSFYINTIKTETRVERNLTRWLYENNKRLERQITVEEFKQLLIKEGLKPNDYEIKRNIESEFDDGYKQLVIELWYNGTVNYIRIGGKGTVSVKTYLISQIPYWESQGHQFSTTTSETIEKFAHKRSQ